MVPGPPRAPPCLRGRRAEQQEKDGDAHLSRHGRKPLLYLIGVKLGIRGAGRKLRPSETTRFEKDDGPRSHSH
jgi:hypothetical protein